MQWQRKVKIEKEKKKMDVSREVNWASRDIRGMQTQPVIVAQTNKTMVHLLCCPLLEQKCTFDDLVRYDENA